MDNFYSFSQLFPPGRVMLVFNSFRGRLRLAAVHDAAAFPLGLEHELTDPLLGHLADIVDATPDTRAAGPVARTAFH